MKSHQKRRKNKQILDWENFWKRYVEKRTNNAVRKEKRVHIKCKQRIPLNKWIIQFLLCSEEDTIASIKQKLNYTFGMVKTSMVKKHKTVQSLFKTCQECWRMRINFYQHF